MMNRLLAATLIGVLLNAGRALAQSDANPMPSDTPFVAPFDMPSHTENAVPITCDYRQLSKSKLPPGSNRKADLKMLRLCYHESLANERAGRLKDAFTNMLWTLPTSDPNNAYLTSAEREGIKLGWARIQAKQYHNTEVANLANMPPGLKGDERAQWIGQGRPDHVEVYDAQNYHKETWWYYKSSGWPNTEAYTFLNGKLVSHFQP